MSYAKIARLAVLPAAAMALAAGLPAPVLAKDKAPAKSEYLEALRVCQGQSDPGQRLACYDAAVGRVVAATDDGELRVVDREDMQRTRRSLFGFALPDIGLFGGGKGDDTVEQLDMLESTITSVRRTNGDAYLLTIAEGDATWQITNAPMRFTQPRVGDKVVFKRASLGSYFIRVNNQIGVKGTRVR